MAKLTWLVTGCSSGLGEQLVHSILARGDQVIATGRNASERLAHLKPTGAALLDLDVSLPPVEIDARIEAALAVYGGIDVLVNNAAYIESAPIEELSFERLHRNMQTNFFGPINISRSILKHFRAKRSGTLVFVGSLAGWKGEPGATGYCASKFGLEGMVECLQQEIAGFGLRAIIFEPGYIRTQMLSERNLKHEPPIIPDYAEFHKMSVAFERAVHGTEPGDPRKVAERMVDVVRLEGFAKGRTMPNRLPLGTDALKVVREKCEATLALCDEWEDVITSTDIASAASDS